MATPLGVLLTLVVVLLAVLAVPVELALAREETGPLRAWLIWGGLRMPLPLRLTGRKDRERKRPRREKRSRGGRRALRMLRRGDVRAHLAAGLKRLLQCFALREADLQVRVGLADPADTGMLWGWLGPVLATLPAAWWRRVRIAPDFMGGGLQATGHLRVRLVPLEVLAVAAQWGLAPTLWRAWRAEGREP